MTYGVWNVTAGHWATRFPMSLEEAQAWIAKDASSTHRAYLVRAGLQPDTYEVRPRD